MSPIIMIREKKGEECKDWNVLVLNLLVEYGPSIVQSFYQNVAIHSSDHVVDQNREILAALCPLLGSSHYRNFTGEAGHQFDSLQQHYNYQL